MVMRFMGGGIGHKSTNTFTQKFAHDARNFSTNSVDDDLLEDENDSEGEDFEEAEGVEEENYGYVIESEAEEGAEEEEEEDLGGEDGEEPWEMGDIQAEGFDDL